MKVTAVKTHKIIPQKDTDLYKILDQYLPNLKEKTIVAISSKIVAICEGRFVPTNESKREDLVPKEADYYIPADLNKYGVTVSIKENILVASAGIDESNGSGFWILWPKSPQQSANKIREYLKKKFNLKNVGVIITDSTMSPLRGGTKGISIAHSGFLPLKNYIGTPDLFGHQLKVTKANIADSLAASAVLVMGEGAEQTPIVVIEDTPSLEFVARNPKNSELAELKYKMEDDIYSSFLLNAPWEKGRR